MYHPKICLFGIRIILRGFFLRNRKCKRGSENNSSYPLVKEIYVYKEVYLRKGPVLETHNCFTGGTHLHWRATLVYQTFLFSPTSERRPPLKSQPPSLSLDWGGT